MQGPSGHRLVVDRAGLQQLSRGLGFCGALGLSLLTYASPGEAADAQRFSWSWVRMPGAETCAAADDIAGNVRARLGRNPFASPAERHIEGWAERSGDPPANQPEIAPDPVPAPAASTPPAPPPPAALEPHQRAAQALGLGESKPIASA